MNQRYRYLLVAAAVVASSCGDFRQLSTAPTESAIGSASLARVASPTNVTTTVNDADAAGTLLLTRSDGIIGTGFATYTAVNSVESRIYPDGSWQLLLANQTARKVYLVLKSQGIPLPDGYYSASVELYSQCFDANNVQVSLTTIPAGGSNGNCSFGVDFSSGTTKYKLVMSPVKAGTGRALVTCNSASMSGCVDWTIVPNTGVTNAGVANLYHFGKSGSLVLDGTYKNSYSVKVMSP